MDDNNINSIRLVNLDGSGNDHVPTLMEPALNDLAARICEKQSGRNYLFR